MPTSTNKILAINPGTRYLGIAVFHGPELRDWGTRGVKGKWSAGKDEKLKELILTLIAQHRPEAIAIKKLHPSRSSKQLDFFVSSIKLMAEGAGLPLYEYPIKYLEAYFSPGNKISKRKLAELLAQRHPSLFQELKKDGSNSSRYYLWMFEAVAVGAVCFQQLDRQ